MGNDVGYRKPPKHTQFKKGRSGNPSGRPKYRKSFTSLIDEILSVKRRTQLDGKAQSLTFKEMIVMRLVKNAVQGDIRSINLLLKNSEKVEDFYGVPPKIIVNFGSPEQQAEAMKKCIITPPLDY